MSEETKRLMNEAKTARALLSAGQISYEEARAVAKRYVDHANVKGAVLAKEYGVHFKPISVMGFLR